MKRAFRSNFREVEGEETRQRISWSTRTEVRQLFNYSERKLHEAVPNRQGLLTAL